MIIFLSYLFYFIAASASPLQRRWLAKNKNHGNTGQANLSFHTYLISAVGSLFFLFFSPFHLSGDTYYLIFLAFICGAFGAVYSVTSYIAQKHVEAGVSTIISNIYTPITIVLATIFLKEGLAPMQVLGTVLLLLGMLIVAKKHHLGKFRFDKYFLLMLFSGVCLGILLTAERALQTTTGFTAGTMISWWTQCIVAFIIAIYMREKNQYSKNDILITGGLRFLQGTSYVILLWVVGNLSLVSAVTTFKIVIIFIAAALFLHEREDLGRKVAGSIVALIGLLLMK